MKKKGIIIIIITNIIFFSILIGLTGFFSSLTHEVLMVFDPFYRNFHNSDNKYEIAYTGGIYFTTYTTKNEHYYLGGSVLIYTILSNNNRDDIYLITDNLWYESTNEIENNIFYYTITNQLYKIIIENKNEYYESWGSLEKISNLKEKKIFISMYVELSNWIKIGKIKLKPKSIEKGGLKTIFIIDSEYMEKKYYEAGGHDLSYHEFVYTNSIISK